MVIKFLIILDVINIIVRLLYRRRCHRYQHHRNCSQNLDSLRNHRHFMILGLPLRLQVDSHLTVNSFVRRQ